MQGTNYKDATMKLFPCARSNHTALPFHWIGVPAFAALLTACGGGANDAASTAAALGVGPSGRFPASSLGQRMSLMGRQHQFATLGCSRLVAHLSRL